MKKYLFHSLTVVSLIAVALAFAVPAGAQDTNKTTKATRPPKHEFTGEIMSIDAVKKTVTVKNKDAVEKTFVVADKAKIILKGKEAAELGDLKVGVKITTTYTEDGTTLTAHRIVNAGAKPAQKKPEENK